ncbi:MAG: hypothetical protein H6621_06520 [Halobacteriovoraceae bacterium]|nr:hypothetical protein [Halobacteriovoraceae bacterium]
MKVYVLKYFFDDDLENEIKGVYIDKNRAIKEMEKLVKFENENKVSEYDRPFEKVSELKYEGYAEHFGVMFYEVEETEINKEAK